MAAQPPPLAKLWSSGDSDRLLLLARQIEDHEAWRPHLNSEEHSIFAKAIATGGDDWSRLISTSSAQQMHANEASSNDNSTEPLADTQDEENRQQSQPPANEISGSSLHTPQPSPTPTSESITPAPIVTNGVAASGSSGSQSEAETGKDKERHIDYVALAMKIRYMLYEQSVDYLFATTSHPVSTAFDIDFSAFAEDDLEENKRDNSEPSPVEKPPPARHVDEDDYDDDDGQEEEDQQPDKSETTEKDTAFNESDNKFKSKLEDKPADSPNKPESKSLSRSCSRTGTPQKRSDESDTKVADGIITPAGLCSLSIFKLVFHYANPIYRYPRG